MPKSMTLASGWPSTSETRTFEGFRSRWMTPLVWACCTAAQSCANSSSRPRIGRRRRSHQAVIGSPFTHSMTKKGRPVEVVPASKTLAMPGWSISASAWRSCSKRASTWRESIPGLSSLSATRRRTGSLCSAR